MTNFTDALARARSLTVMCDNCGCSASYCDCGERAAEYVAVEVPDRDLLVEVAELAVEYWQLWQDADTKGKVTDLARMMEIDDRLMQLLSGEPESKGEGE